MKKIKLSLFEKMKDKEISINTCKIMGGEEPPESSSRTGDIECTGGGTDCTDQQTTFLSDAIKTDPNQDHC